MGDEAATFNCKNESGRRAFTPSIESFWRGQAVKAIIQFDSIEMPLIEREHLFGGQIFRVERSHPMTIVPARSPDANLARHVFQDGLAQSTVACAPLGTLLNGNPTAVPLFQPKNYRQPGGEIHETTSRFLGWIRC